MPLKQQKKGDLVYFIDPDIPVPHAFSTRLGGVSAGMYESLNFGINLGDNPEHVRENYTGMLHALDSNCESLVFGRQIHTDIVRLVGKKDALTDLFQTDLAEADALVTSEKDLTLTVFTADCIPILLWDAESGAVSAIHAGWRSTVLDIAGKAVRALVAHTNSAPEHIRAAIGPGIGPCCFETDKEVPQAVNTVLGNHAVHCIVEKEHEKAMVDLKEVNRRLLLLAGVLPERISVSEHCTMCHPEYFWSHRKMGKSRGSLASFIRMSDEKGRTT